MSESLLDEALRFCEGAIDVMCDTPMRTALRARFDVLERATWSLSLVPAAEEKVIRLARLVLELRDDVQDARVSDERISGTWRCVRLV
jgi:hypothetical protein